LKDALDLAGIDGPGPQLESQLDGLTRCDVTGVVLRNQWAASDAGFGTLSNGRIVMITRQSLQKPDQITPCPRLFYPLFTRKSEG
jgi:hypothetical protein